MNDLPKPKPTRRANCGADVTNQLAAGVAKCETCRSALPEELLDKDAAADKRRWRRAFLIIFFATPALSLLAAFLPQLLHTLSLPAIAHSSAIANFAARGVFGTPFLGAFASGYCLMTQCSSVPTSLEAFFLPIAYGVGILIVYLCIFFMGCIVVVLVTKN